MKQLLTVSAAFALILGFTAVAYAQGNVAKEVDTAHTHAMLAHKATSVKMVHTHLHHVINCLVGPDGDAFDSSVANPCKGMGNGAIPDSSGNDAVQSKLKEALAAAQAGVKSDSLKTAQQKAAKAAETLKATPVEKSSGGYS